ncbi:MAG: hypothetical protein ABIM98_00210 [candidate division WOR-3 bacterium]
MYLLNEYWYWEDVTYIPQKKMDYVYLGGINTYIFCEDFNGRGYLLRFFKGSSGIGYGVRVISAYGKEEGFHGVIWRGGLIEKVNI